MKYIFLLICTLFTIICGAQDIKVKMLVDEGVRLHDKGDYWGAINKYKEALILEPENESAIYESCITYMLLKDYKKSIECADKLITIKSRFSDQAYVNKASALDVMGKYDDAVATYKEGIQKYPKEYMLYYNLSLTYFQAKEIDKAEKEIYAALLLNPDHASSNLVLAYCMYYKEKRIQSMLAFYYFLMLEPKSGRSEQAFAILKELRDKGVSKKDNNTINISLPSGDQSDPFSVAETFLSLSVAASHTEKEAGKTMQENFVSRTDDLFAFLSESEEKKYAGCWQYYISFFSDLHKSKNVEAFTYHIAQSDEDFGSDKWLKTNSTKYNAFLIWVRNATSGTDKTKPIIMEDRKK